jgi:hypothetical protein
MRAPKTVIYRAGEDQIQTTVTDGRADLTGGLTVAEHLAQMGPGYAEIDFSEALEQINVIQTQKYIKGWQDLAAEVRALVNE